jgi:NADPH-dependent 2,4-dienoyl-CoA reductase/sulfur reductase-like enzyme
MRLVAVGGSDAGITAAVRARELDPDGAAIVIVADCYPNFSICGIPYYVSGEVTVWRNLAHCTLTDLQATGMSPRLDTRAHGIDAEYHRIHVTTSDGDEALDYDALVVGTGAMPITPPIRGLDQLGPRDGVHLLHSMGDTFALMDTLARPDVERAVIVGGGYIGLEMAEALTTRDLSVTQVEQLPEVLPTVDPDLGALVHRELERHGVTVACGTRVDAIEVAPPGSGGRLDVLATGPAGDSLRLPADVVLIVVGVRPDSDLAASAGTHPRWARPRTRCRRALRPGSGPGVRRPAGDHPAVNHHHRPAARDLPPGSPAPRRGTVGLAPRRPRSVRRGDG